MSSYLVREKNSSNQIPRKEGKEESNAEETFASKKIGQLTLTFFVRINFRELAQK